jgi:hypothetical protein
MDANCFDTLARSLTTTRSRRGALVTLLGGALGLLGLSDTAAKKGKRNGKGKKKNKGGNPTGKPPPGDPSASPPPWNECAALFEGAVCDGSACKACRSGACVVDASRERAACGNDGCLICVSGVCSTNPKNDIPCGVAEGRCYRGECNAKPTCQGGALMCPADEAGCCSGRCGGQWCAPGARGALCQSGFDCTSQSCVGYRCQ